MAGAQRSPSRAPSSAGNRNMDDSANGAALLGALMAFGGASKTNGDMIRSRGNSPGTSASSLRRPPPSRMTNTSPSPYRQPTALAAARMSPVPPLRPNYTGEAALQRAPADKQRPGPPPLKPKPRRLSEHQLKPASTSHIPPSTSFVGIVENNTLRSPKSKHSANVPRKPFSDMEVRGQANATPHEGKDQERGDKDGAQRQEGKGGAHTGSKGLPTGQSVPAKVQGKQQTGYGGPRGKEVQGTPVRKTQRDNGAEAVISDGESSQEYVSASEDTAPSPATQRKQKPDAVSQQSPVSLPSRSPLSHAPQLYPNGMSQPVDIARRPRTSDSSARSTSSHSNPSISATYHQLYPRRTTPLTLGDDLANAMVASSLAASRASSPHRLAPPVPQPRRPSHLSPWRSRTPSPTKAKGMRHTLREPESSSESDTEQHPYGKHKKKRHLRPKHPNKHHEGDRKRWRDAVTERERKRYEALFASNRGLLLAPSQQSHISPIVVRDLWIRSRLPLSELEYIWNLVAPHNDEPAAFLSKEEFVVGLWLIDQRLKGRKLPVKVSETVWASVRGLQGIKVKKFSG